MSAIPNSLHTVLGIDIGTGSARAALFDLQGNRIGVAIEPIQMWTPHADWAEQSSEDIWNAIGKVVRQVVSKSRVDPANVIGIGYDATCSLVVLDRSDRPLSVSDSGDNRRNVIVWMDHRALLESEEINAGAYDVLKFVGGKVSPEMETPKLLWLKRHMSATWTVAGKFFDLADFLVYASTGQDIRSLCTTVCKWTYLGHEDRWDTAYFEAIGIGDCLDRIGDNVRPMGELAGFLTPQAAQHLGLTTNTAVGVGIIDAHAGGLGLLGAVWEGSDVASADALETALALIGGTSTCHMAVSREPRWIPGIWGPYFSAMAPGMWLTEGGQSATGALIDNVLKNHAASPALLERAATDGVSVYEIVNQTLHSLAREAGCSDIGELTANLHVLDYHLGNRSPIADPRARGMVDGLNLDVSIESLALLYLAAIQAVAYGTKAIIDALNANGFRIEHVYVVGGGTKNPVWLQQHADITGATLHLPAEPESVLLGASILGAVASGAHPDIYAAMKAMSRSGTTVAPRLANSPYHAAKYACYKRLYATQLANRQDMGAFH